MLKIKTPTKQESVAPLQSIAKPSTSMEPEDEPQKKPEDKKTEDKKPATKTKSSEINDLLTQIRKDKGDKVVVTGNNIPEVFRIPTGIFEFDLATGGGFPQGRCSIIFGGENSGKSNICYSVAANAQKLPDTCNKVVWVDLEGTFDPKWASMFGVDVANLLVVRPSYGEEAVDLIDALLRANDVALLVVDSIAVMIAAKEVNQSTEKADVGTSSLLTKRMANKISHGLTEEAKRDHFPAIVLINQIRHKIGVLFGSPETTPGGFTVKFLSSLTIRLHGTNKIVKEISSEVPAFKETSATIRKAKVKVNKMAFEYDLCMLPHDGLSVGETRSWSLVSGHLKDLGHLKKADKGTGWTLLGKTYPTLVVIQHTYEAEDSFKLKLQKMVLDSFKDKGFMIEAAPQDKTVGGVSHDKDD